jgi:uncharacterized protein GlcG (DUF336 family)
LWSLIAAGTSWHPVTHGMHDMLVRDDRLTRALAATDDQIITLPGGFPLTEITTLVGGFGIAGGHYEQDQLVGERVMKALAASITDVAR